MSRAFLGLGSNLGDRLGILKEAVQLLTTIKGVLVVQASPVYETEPVGFEIQPPFLNMVVAVDTLLRPEELLDRCDQVERRLGRVRSATQAKWGPRTIDIDLLYVEPCVSPVDTLSLPHPRMLERRFVLQPLSDIAPDLIISGAPVCEHLTQLEDPHRVRLLEEGIDLASL